MKIGNPAAVIPEQAPVSSTGNGRTAAAPGAATDSSAKIELSSTATSLLSNAATADFDAAKVSRVSLAIADGKFEINAEAIADKLIANAAELLANGKQ